ncbi:MAG: hypothetical protein HQL46_16295, partial [Gammaproteobacteria bacterium]|nr:hypothetical protein [Gammaproteobacteria bacterium]
KQSMINLTLNFGKSQGDKVILNRKGIDKMLSVLEQLKKDALKIREKGGLVVVDVNNALITAYALDSHKFGCSRSSQEK